MKCIILQVKKLSGVKSLAQVSYSPDNHRDKTAGPLVPRPENIPAPGRLHTA